MTCRSSENACEIMRTCPRCKRVLKSTGRRIVHQNTCPQEMDFDFSTVQHEHGIRVHGSRRRS